MLHLGLSYGVNMKIHAVLPVVNTIGGIAVALYFTFILPANEVSAVLSPYYYPIFYICGSLVLAVFFLLTRGKSFTSLTNVAYGKTPIGSMEDDEVRYLQRGALQLPFRVSVINFMVWILAGFIFGLLEPMIKARIFGIPTPDLVFCVRQFLGISLLGGGITTMVLYFVFENAWRSFVPRFFPEGHLNQVKHVFTITVKKRFLIVLMGIAFIPLPIIGTTIYTKVNALHVADAVTRANIMSALAGEIVFILADSLFISFLLAYLLAKSISRPLLNIKNVIREVEKDNLDVQADIMSNDEIGEVAQGLNRMIHSLNEGRKARENFGKYVCKEIRDEILAGNTSLDGEMKRVTLLFSDLRNFTGMVEKNHPKDVVKIMNQYFNEMTLAVKNHKGLILQYVGDEIEAAFGAPVGFEDHPEMAVQTALEMRNRLEALNRRLAEQGFAPLNHGIGIHSGAVLAGNIGSTERMSYALVGDTVNTASRIGGLAKMYECDIILSQTTHSLLTGSYRTKQLRPVSVKGKEDELIVYKLLA